MTGVTTPNLPTANLIDDLIGNAGGNTVRILPERLAAMLQTFQGPSYATLAQLTADRSWPAGTLAAVWNDGAANGVYRKSGNVGAGNWSRIGDLPMSSFGADLLAQKADTAALTAETIARIAATRDAGVLPLASVAGTANAITAVIDPALTGVTLSALSTVELIPATDNTGPATLNVGGAGAWPVQRGDGTPVEAGDLRAGVSYLLRRRSSAWRIIAPSLGDGQGIARTEGVLSTVRLSEIATTVGSRNWGATRAETMATPVRTDAAYAISDLISVRRGQCFRLYLPIENISTADNVVAFYDGESTPAGSLVLTARRDPPPGSGDHVGAYAGDVRARYRYFRIPRDGYIRVHRKLAVDGNAALLQEITLDLYIEQHRYLGRKENLRRLDVTTPVIAFHKSLYGIPAQPAEIGWGGQSERIPVLEGQYVQAYSGLNGSSVVQLVHFSPSGGVLGKYQSHHNFEGRHIDALGVGGLMSLENFRVPADGFVALQMSTGDVPVDDGAFLVVTDKYFDYARRAQEEGDPVPVPRYSGVDLIPSADGASPGMRMTPAADVDVIGPVFLRKGQIARVEVVASTGASTYSVAWKDTRAVALARNTGTQVIPDSTLHTGVTIAAQRQVQWVSSDDGPMVIAARTQSGEGNIRVVSAEEFRAERAAILAAMRPVSGRTPNPAGVPQGAVGTVFGVGYIPLLAGEVLRYKAANIANISSIALDRRPEPSDSRFGAGEDYLAILPRVALTNDAGPAPEHQPRYAAASRFGWFGYTVSDHAGFDPETFFNDAPLTIYSHVEYRALDDGELLHTVPGLVDDTVGLANGELSIASWIKTNAAWEMIRPVFIPRGQCIEWKTSGSSSAHLNPVFHYRNTSGDLVRTLLLKQPLPGGSMKMQGVSGYYMAPADGYLWLNHRLAPGGSPADGSPEALVNHMDQLSVRFIDESEYHENTRLFEGNLLVIPDPRGLEFRHFNGWMAWDASSARNHTEVILQIRQNGAILANLLNREEVQGQSTASGPKPNLDLKCRNAFGKRVSFKWGNWKESNKACLKAYNTEKTHIRDTASAEIWRQIRRHRPYPDDLIYDPRVRLQVDTWPQARFLADAVCSTRGVPCTVLAGGKSNGIYTLREKKDILNYAINADDPNHIWLQSDYEAHGKFIDWSAPLDFRAWEITSPELPGYQSGDDVSDAAPDLATKMRRLFQWISDAKAGTVDFAATHQDYIYLDSWMDYLIAGELVRHQDGVTNNVILTTQDAERWSVHIYDMDWSLGVAVNGTAQIGTSGWLFSGSNAGVWSMIHAQMRPQLEARWADLRTGPLRKENVLSIIRGISAQMSDADRTINRLLWGMNAATDDSYILDWVIARIDWIDGQLG